MTCDPVEPTISLHSEDLEASSAQQWRLIHWLRGEALLFINRQRLAVRPGTTFLLRPDDLIRSDANRQGVSDREYFLLNFNLKQLIAGLPELQEDFHFFNLTSNRQHNHAASTCCAIGHDLEIRRIVRTIHEETERKRANYRIRIRLLLLELLILLARSAENHPHRQSAAAVVNYIDHLIETRFREELQLDMIEEQTGIVKSRLCRLYRAGTGQTIMDSLRIRRLNEAAERLTATRQAAVEIGKECGFPDPSYFYRVFRRKYGVTPGEFRRKFQN